MRCAPNARASEALRPLASISQRACMRCGRAGRLRCRAQAGIEAGAIQLQAVAVQAEQGVLGVRGGRAPEGEGAGAAAVALGQHLIEHAEFAQQCARRRR